MAGNVLADLVVRIRGDATGVAAAFAGVKSEMSGLALAATALTAVGTAMTVGVTAPLLAVGVAGLESAVSVQKGYSIIIGQTGETGAALAKLKSQFGEVFANVPQSAEQVGTVIATLADRLRGLGYDISVTSRYILDLARVSNESAPALASSVSAMFLQWKVSAGDATKVIEELNETFEATHVPLTQLSADVDKYGTVWRAAGFDLHETMAIMAQMDAAGLNSTDIVRGMAYGWANLQKASQATKGPLFDAYTAISGATSKLGLDTSKSANMMAGLFQGIKDGSVSSAAAVQIFGSRFGTNIIQAIKEGRISSDEFIASLKEMPDHLERGAKSALTFGQQLEILKHKLELAFAPLGEAFLTAFSDFMPVIEKIIGGVAMIVNAFNTLPTPVKNMIILFAAVAAAAGPLMVIAGILITTFISLAGSIGTLIGIGLAPLVSIIGVVTTIAGGLVTTFTVISGAIVSFILAPFAAIFGLIGLFVSLAGAAVALGATLIIVTPVVIVLGAVAAVLGIGLAAVVGSLAALTIGLLVAYTQMNQFSAVFGAARAAIETFGQKLSTAFSFFIKGDIKAGITGIADSLSYLYDKSSIGVSIIEAAKVGLKRAISTIGAVWTDISTSFVKWEHSVDWGGMAKKITDAIAKGLVFVGSTLVSVWNIILTSFNNWKRSIDWNGVAKTIPQDIIKGLKIVQADLMNIWNTIKSSFDNWKKSVNFTQLGNDITAELQAGLNTGMSIVGPVWDFISLSFNNWRNSVNWQQLASDIPIQITAGIAVIKDTLGPVWDSIVQNLINWIHTVNWKDIGEQWGSGLRTAIKTALDSLVGTLSELIPGNQKGGESLVGVGVDAAKNFVSGFQTGLGDLWKLIMDGLEPLAGKIADYLENNVDWEGIGNAIGTILGSIIASAMGVASSVQDALGPGQKGTSPADWKMSGQSGGPMSEAAYKNTDEYRANIPYKTYVASATSSAQSWNTPSGWEKLTTAAEDMGDKIAKGFVKGAQDAMANINWKGIILGGIEDSLGLKDAVKGGPLDTTKGSKSPYAVPSWAETVKGGPLDPSFDWGGAAKGIGGTAAGIGGGIWGALSSPLWPNLSLPNLGGVKFPNLLEGFQSPLPNIGGGVLDALTGKGGISLPAMPNLSVPKMPWDMGWLGGSEKYDGSLPPGKDTGSGILNKDTWGGAWDWVTGGKKGGVGVASAHEFGQPMGPEDKGGGPLGGFDFGALFAPLTSLKLPALPDLGSIFAPLTALKLPAMPDLQSILSPLANLKLPAMPDLNSILTPLANLKLPAMPNFGEIFAPLTNLKIPGLSDFKWPTLPGFSWPTLPSFGWPTLPSFGWPTLPGFSWPTLPSFHWPTLPSFSWPTLPSFTWPTLPSFSWPTLPGFNWPNISGPDWGSFIPHLDWHGFVPFAQGGVVKAAPSQPSTITNASQASIQATNSQPMYAHTTTSGDFSMSFASGGLVKAANYGLLTNGPQLVLAGEAGDEAFIPLQGGKIPVSLGGRGSSSGGTNIYISIPNARITSKHEAEVLSKQMGEETINRLRRAGLAKG